MPKNVIPFAEMTHITTPRLPHVMVSVKAMLRVAERGACLVTENDLAGCFGELTTEIDSELLELIKSNVRTAAAAAGLVFMHSACENAVYVLMKRLIHYDPEPWLKFIDEKSVSLKRLRIETLARIQDELLSRWLKKAERKSFPWKVEKLLAALQPSTTKDIIHGFEFSMDRFKQIDKIRHEVTHEPWFGTAIAGIYDHLSYLSKTVRLLETLAERKYPGSPNWKDVFSARDGELHQP